MGVLTKMKISSDSEGGSFDVLINPASIKRSKKINYDKKAVQGTVSAEPKFNSYENDTLDFELILDGTGVIPGASSSSKPKEVSEEIDKLNKIIYDYQGSQHEPNVVTISWGTTLFKGRLESLSIDYTLFKPAGAPLRAKLGLKFVQFRTNAEAVKEAQNQSPDMTHLVAFKAGDNLQALCNKIYGDGSYASEVAKLNGLTSFRNIRPGTQMFFSPLKK